MLVNLVVGMAVLNGDTKGATVTLTLISPPPRRAVDRDSTYVTAWESRLLAEQLVKLIAFGSISLKAVNVKISIAHSKFTCPTSVMAAKIFPWNAVCLHFQE